MFRFRNFVDDAVRKSFGVTPADVFARMTPRIEQRIFCQRIPDLNDLLYKFCAQTGLLRLIPARGFSHVGFDFRPEFHSPVHFLNCERRLDFISSNGTAEAGFLRCAARRFSTNAPSAGDNPGSSKSSARRTSNCRSFKVRVGNSCKTFAKLMAKI